VRARTLRLSALSVFASLSIVDSLLNGRSKFLAEVERLRLAIEAAAKKPVLFLVDEIFGGTNSRDRRIAAEAVVRTLVNRRAKIARLDAKFTQNARKHGPCRKKMRFANYKRDEARCLFHLRSQQAPGNGHSGIILSPKPG